MAGQAIILSVGGDPESSKTLGELFFRSGYDLRQVENDASALTAIAAEPPDLIFINPGMPGALALCRRINSDHRGRHIPVVMMSSSTNAMDLAEGLRAGAADFITSPFQPEELLMRVNMHLERSRPRGQQEEKAQLRGMKDRGRAEAALRESEACFRRMANSAPLMIVASGPDKQATFFNKRWLEFRGRTMNQELGWGWTEGLHPDDREECLARYSRSFEARGDCYLEYRLRRADGEYRSIMCSGIPRYGAGGAFIGYIGSCVDVTDLTRGEQERQKLQEAKNLTLFAAGVAHDFNNLLAAALAEMDLALPELAFDAPARRHIQSIERILTRASDIVDLLISYSATGNPPALEAISLSALVEDVIHLMDGVLSQKRVRVISRLASNLPPILANGPQIRRVVMNLITNAIEALDSAAGSITVSTSLARIGPDQEKTSALKEGDYVSLSVADTGHGMTGETLTKALDPFFTTKSKGRGLGLAVVHGIVRSHRGSVRASSGSGQGATFEVFLPCATARHVEPDAIKPNDGHEAAHADIPQSGLMTVLLIEDEQMLRSATGAALEDRGFRVLYACDGGEALERIRDTARDIDAVVLDLSLPDMSGLEVVAKTAQLRPDARIIMTSGHYLDAHNLEVITGDGKRFFLRKPYRLSELVQTLLHVQPGSTTDIPGGQAEPLH